MNYGIQQNVVKQILVYSYAFLQSIAIEVYKTLFLFQFC